MYAIYFHQYSKTPYLREKYGKDMVFLNYTDAEKYLTQDVLPLEQITQRRNNGKLIYGYLFGKKGKDGFLEDFYTIENEDSLPQPLKKIYDYKIRINISLEQNGVPIFQKAVAANTGNIESIYSDIGKHQFSICLGNVLGTAGKIITEEVYSKDEDK